MKTRFSADNIKEILTDLTYAGIGAHEAIVDEDLLLDALVRMIEEEGAQAVIQSILEKFDETSVHIPDAAPYVELAESNPRVALSRLLNDMQQLTQLSKYKRQTSGRARRDAFLRKIKEIKRKSNGSQRKRGK